MLLSRVERSRIRGLGFKGSDARRARIAEQEPRNSFQGKT